MNEIVKTVTVCASCGSQLGYDHNTWCWDDKKYVDISLTSKGIVICTSK